MIRFILIVAVIISITCGSYALLLLGRFRKIYKLEFINSFFYYEFLKLVFGLYGIFGGLAIREILLRYELQSGQIESIVLAIPFFGIPFIVAGWYILIKMSTELRERKVNQYIALLYFILVTISFLIYGYILRGVPENRTIQPDDLSQLIRIVFYSIDLLVKIYVAIILLRGSKKLKHIELKGFLRKISLLIILIAIMSSLALHFARLHPLIGIYFILLFFGGDLVLILITKNYLINNSGQYLDVTDKLEHLYQRYGISKREKDIISEICKGLTNQQIADNLFISLQTVKDHTHNIFKKVNVSNRVQLTQIFS